MNYIVIHKYYLTSKKVYFSYISFLSALSASIKYILDIWYIYLRYYDFELCLNITVSNLVETFSLPVI